MGETWHQRAKRFEQAQRERVASPDVKVKHPRKWLWIVLAIALILFLHFVLHFG